MTVTNAPQKGKSRAKQPPKLHVNKQLRFTDIVDVNPRPDLPPLSPDDLVSFIPMSDVDDHGHWVRRQTRKFAEVRQGYTPVREGDILFAKITPCTQNGKGLHALGLCNGVAFGSTEFHVLRSKTGINPRFVYHVSMMQPVRLRAAAMMGGSAGQQRVPDDFFRIFRLSSTILKDQDKTARLLDSIDEAIRQIRGVVKQARRLKTAALQSVLSRGLPRQQTRFHQVRLGDVFEERCEKGQQALPIVSVTIRSGLVPRQSLGRRLETDLRAEQHLVVRTGDIAYNMMRMWQGVSGVADYDCLVSPAYVVVRPMDGIVSAFAGHLFKSPTMIRLFHRFSQGLVDDRLRLYFDQFKSIRANIPQNTEDQQRIAEILSSFDDHIRAENAKLDQLTKFKIALSQALLAGRAQVIQPKRGGRP